MSEFEQAREAFRQRWGFDPAPVVEDAFRRGEFDLEGGTEDERAFIRQILTAPRDGGRFTLYPAGDCAHCGLLINESHLLESVAGGGVRPVIVLVHTGSGHERCEARDTVAGRSSEPEEQQ